MYTLKYSTMKSLYCVRKQVNYKNAILIPCLLLLFTSPSFAQGWTFTFQLYVQGNCGGVQPPPITVPNLNIPTQGECEALRQQVLAIQYSGGNCSVGYTCTPCTGADILKEDKFTPPVDFSLAGSYEGKPLFSIHPSAGLEDWGKDYKQKQEVLGYASYLGTVMSYPAIPLTEDKQFNEFYGKETLQFEPPEQGGVVDLTESSVTENLNEPKIEKPKPSTIIDSYQNESTIPPYPDMSTISIEKGIVNFPGGYSMTLEEFQKFQNIAFVTAGVAVGVVALFAAPEAIAAAGVWNALTAAATTADVVAYSLPVIQVCAVELEDCIYSQCPNNAQIASNVGNIIGGIAQSAIGTIASGAVGAYTQNYETANGILPGLAYTSLPSSISTVLGQNISNTIGKIVASGWIGFDIGETIVDPSGGTKKDGNR